MFFAAYRGPSMNPTLREPETMEVLPYGRRPLRVGDVILFLSPATGQPIVHRVVRVVSTGISTLGDNNTQEDAFLLQSSRIQGQVVAAWRGQRRRRIAGGLHGRFTRRWAHWQRTVDRGVSPLLHPLYHALSRWSVFAWMMPVSFRPRVVVFHTEGCDRVRLLLGQQVIGRYDSRSQRWEIRRPFQLLVDARCLAVPQGGTGPIESASPSPMAQRP